MAETPNIEDIQFEVEGKLRALSVEESQKVADFLGLESTVIESFKEKSRRAIFKVICKSVEDQLIEQEDGVEWLKRILDLVQTPPVEPKQSPSELSESSDYDQAKKEFEELQKLLKEAELKVNAASKESVPKVTSLSTTTDSTDVQSIFRREFRIMGVVGGDNQKEKLSFVGLMRQIEGGKAKGYQESEIIDAVIRAIHPSDKLKLYFEMTRDVTLTKLTQMLRVHYHEKTGTELYQELTTLVQGTSETPQDFLMRALALRERVIFASQATDAIMKYEPRLVQSLFIHSVETGLRDEVVRNKLRGLLHQPMHTDEELMECLNKIVSVENERQKKIGPAAKESPVESATPLVTPTANTKGKSQTSQFNLKASVEAMQVQLNELSERMSTFNNSKQKKPGAKRSLCQACQDAKETKCNHCFKCGSSEHFARGCKAPSPGAENGKELRPRDRE